MAVPNIFANVTTSIPLSQLDQNFATAITLGNTAVYLGNTTTTLGNVTLANANVTTALTIAGASGTSGQVLTSGGANTAPTWSTVSPSAATPTALGTVYGSTSSGSSVTLLGYQAGNASISGGNNTVVGFTAGTALTSGNGNTLTGYRAGTTMTSGSANSFYGIDAGKLLTTGAYNVGVGIEALRSATTSDANIGVGAYALQVATTGASNLGIGYNTLGALTTATGNVALGREAGSALTTGSYNIYIGYQTGNGTKTGGVDCIYIGRTITPNNAGVNGEMVINTNGNNATGKGDGTGFITTGGNLYNGLNTSAWQTTSDRRLKKNITDNTEGLDKIAQIRVRNFEYKLPEEITELQAQDAIQKSGVQLGVIAQELQEVCSDCVKEESTGVLSVDASNLTWHMVNAIKDLKALNDSLTARIVALESK